MFTRVSALWLVLGLAGGYVFAGPTMTAQGAAVSPVPPFVIPGDEVTLQFERGIFHENVSTVRCAVAAIEGIWLKCDPVGGFQGQREQRWLNIERVVQITKRDR